MNGKPKRIANVPCNGCVACCSGSRDAIFIHPECGDDALAYDTQIVEGRLALKWRENGDCIYLDREKGCTIHKNRPATCKEFDCRDVFSWPQAARKFASEAVLTAARRLLRQEGKL